MLQANLSHSIIDYRNARYQGQTIQNGIKEGLGILIDDDLSFYVSHWANNMLDGQSLVYISHGKYIYGSWRDNQPTGLNVFRTGDTVLVAQFEQGSPVGKMLVIFQKYNIIAILQRKDENNKFQLIRCGKLFNHAQLLKYIELLGVQMPDHYFSLLKFVTSLTSSNDNDDEFPLIASPCQKQNCYFGYRDGLAIVFNSNNGVVSVGHHQNKRIGSYGGKFDGKSIQQGNFDTQETLVYQKKRPTNQINVIFQKMHKRSLNFRNQYFDSKVKIFGNLQSILKGNIQKIVNYNLKNKIHSATAGDLNDSLDYQNIDEYQSTKNAQNRHNMYQDEGPQFKKTISKYYKDEKQNNKHCFPSKKYSHDQFQRKQNGRIHNKSRIEQQQKEANERQIQTMRKTPSKANLQSGVYYAKKSPIRYRQSDGKIYSPYVPSDNKNTQSNQQISRKLYTNQKFIPTQSVSRLQDRKNIINQVRQKSQNKATSKISQKSQCKPRQKKSQTLTQSIDNKISIPKFGGLQIQQQSNNHRKSSIMDEVEQYKRQIQRSRSKQNPSGRSISKYLKRPNYQDIQQRRKRILNEFKQLNDSGTNSSVRYIPQPTKRTPAKDLISIQILDYHKKNQKSQVTDSPCMKGHILSYTSQNQNFTENSSEGAYMPLSLINNQKSNINKKKQHTEKSKQENIKQTYQCKPAEKDSYNQITSSFKKRGKQNMDLSPSGFSKNRNPKIQKIQSSSQQERNNKIKNLAFLDNIQKSASSSNHIGNKSSYNMGNKKHSVSYNQEQQESQFSKIYIKSQDGSYNQSKVNERDESTVSNDISRRKKSYKYYFQGEK